MQLEVDDPLSLVMTYPWRISASVIFTRGVGLGPVKNHEENDLGITKGVTPVFREICERQLVAVDLRFTVFGKPTNWKKSLSFNCSSISRVVALPKCMSDQGFLIAYRALLFFLTNNQHYKPHVTKLWFHSPLQTWTTVGLLGLISLYIFAGVSPNIW